MVLVRDLISSQFHLTNIYLFLGYTILLKKRTLIFVSNIKDSLYR